MITYEQFVELMCARWPHLENVKDKDLHELYEVKQEYNRNFDLIMKYLGTKKAERYQKKEGELDRLEIRLMKKLKCFVYDPCPARTNLHCDECTGYIKRRICKGQKHGVVLAQPDEDGAFRCKTKLTYVY